jgi:signal transduction histidine kinase/ligand-binding sensor domain-containing protein
MGLGICLLGGMVLQSGAQVSTNQAAPLQDARASYLVNQWQTDEGLPQNSVTSIAQTPDGYLWLGTFDGLARFDGARFWIFNSANTPALASNRILALFVDGHGALWIVSETGDLAQLANGKFTRFTEKEGVPASGVTRLAEDGAGNLWAGSRNNGGCFRFEDGRFVVRLQPKPALKNAAVFALIPTVEGIFWAAQGEDLVQVGPGEPEWFTLDIGRPEPLVRDLGQVRSGGVRWRHGLCRCREGGLWIVAEDGLRKLRAGHWATQVRCPVASVRSMVEDSLGNVWVGTSEEGLFQFDTTNGVHRFKLNTDIKDEPLTALFEDKEANLWVGTDGAGLYRLKQRAFRTFGTQDGLPARVVKSVTEDADGALWVVNPGQVTWFPGRPGQGIKARTLNVSGAWCSMADKNGGVCIGSYGDGIFRCDPSRASKLALPEGKLNLVIYTLFQDRSGTIWGGGQEGLFRVESNSVARFEPSPMLKRIDVRALAEDHAGRLYIGLDAGGLLCYQDGKCVQFLLQQGLAGERISALCVDDADTLWIGGFGSGLSRLAHGRFSNFPSRELHLPEVITTILDDGCGYLWLASNRGLCRVPERELNEFADGRRQTIKQMTYGKSDGLAATEFASTEPAACRARDGTIWFATVGGLSVADPAHLPFNRLPPQVTIEEVAIDDLPAARNEDGVTIPPGRHRLEIHFTALSFTAPEKVRFKYQLEGADPDWVETDARRTAYFTSVSHGRYLFRVIACNNDGVWNQTGATLGVVVLPFYWQTWWFLLLMAVGAGGLIFVSVRMRMTRLRREHAAQALFARQLINSQEEERKRIAGELHDSLGQTLLLVKNRALLGLNQPDLPSPVADHLRQISDSASEAIEEVRATAFALRPYELDRLGLSKATESMIEKVAASSGIKFSSDLDDVGGRFPPEIEISLYRILQEAINNAVRHSGATSVIVEIKQEPPLLRASVLDDGGGFDATTVQASVEQRNGLGLRGIEERAKLIGGAFLVQSAAGKGTRVTLTVPLPRSGTLRKTSA